MNFLRLFLACFLLSVVGHAPRVWGQANGAVRLAVVVEAPSAAQLGDLLTAELTQQSNVQLVERSEIEKVYREQGFSAANRNDLKLGQVLGADGLVFLSVLNSHTNGQTNSQLSVRLTAVKPGVILAQTRFDWPVKEQVQMAKSLASGVAPFVPKLSVSAKDAIAISVVNFRSAVQSTGAQDIDHDVKSLVIQRLSHEPRFFVTERDRMRMLGEERDRNGDDSPFWNGGYLLEGIIDPNGYSPTTIEVHVRLTARKGSEPIEFDAEGSRTNWAEVANQIGAKTARALKIESTTKTLDPAQEAIQFFEEAKWALTWKDFSQAQAAANAAWALGKHDVDCAALRIKAYSTTYYGKGWFWRSEGQIPRGLVENRALFPRVLDKTIKDYPDALFSIRDAQIIRLGFEPPTSVEHLDNALYALNLYREFSQSVPGELKPGTEWYKTGVEGLTAASWVLATYALNASAQPPVKEKLSEVRAAARAVAMLIYNAPAVHDSYFVGDLDDGPEELSPSDRGLAMLFPDSPMAKNLKLADRKDFSDTVEKEPSIFQFLVNWGCFIQETPEATIDLYRELMSTPVFCYVQERLWVRTNSFPRVIAWNKQDHQRIPQLWGSFIQELKSSTNALLRLEGMAFDLADIDVGCEYLDGDGMLSKLERAELVLPPLVTPTKLEECYTNFYETIFSNFKASVSDTEALCFFISHTSGLRPGRDTLRIGWDASKNQAMVSRQYEKYRQLFGALQSEYRQRAAARKQFARQVRYLKEFKKFDRREFMEVFPVRNYTEAEVQELLPLIASYKTNLLASAEEPSQRADARMIVTRFQALESRLNLHPSGLPQNPQPAAVWLPPKPAPPPPPPTPKPEEILSVRRFYPIPTRSLEGESVYLAGIAVPRWSEGKLIVNCQVANKPYVAVFDPDKMQWTVVACAEFPYNLLNRAYNKSVLFQGNLFYSDGGAIRRYDFRNRRWEILGISNGENCQLFVVAGRLYAANRSAIFEIVDSGKATRLLASTRRNPPVSELDKPENWTTGFIPFLFGAGDRVQTSQAYKLYSWNGTDWLVSHKGPFYGELENASESGLLFRNGSTLQRLLPGAEAPVPEVCLAEASNSSLNPPWRLPTGLTLNNFSAALRGSELYLMTSHASAKPIIGKDHQRDFLAGTEVLLTNGYHNELLCFSPGIEKPQHLFLKFESSEGCPPVSCVGQPQARFSPTTWILFTDKALFFGLECSEFATKSGYAGNPWGIWAMPTSELDSAITSQKQKAMATTHEYYWNSQSPETNQSPNLPKQ